MLVIFLTERWKVLALLEQQLAGGKSPFGLSVNGGTGFNMHRLLDSLCWREAIGFDSLLSWRNMCGVWNPTNETWLGASRKMSNPEQQLDAWYDVIESFHNRIESLINNRILPLMEITDWEFRFTTIRPRRDNEIAETRKNQGPQSHHFVKNPSSQSMKFVICLRQETWSRQCRWPILPISKTINQSREVVENSDKNPVPSLSDIFPTGPHLSGWRKRCEELFRTSLKYRSRYWTQ